MRTLTFLIFLSLSLTTAAHAEVPTFEKPVVAVLQAGAKPRVGVPLALAVGATETVAIGYTSSAPGEEPAEVVLALTVSAADEAGITLDLAVSSASDPWRALVGARGVLHVSARGAVESLTITPASADLDALRALVWLALIPYPADGLGAGANWQTTELVHLPGRVRRSGVFRVRAIDQDSLTFDVELARQVLDKAPGDAGATIDSLSQLGRGTATLTRGHLFVDLAALPLATTTKLTVSGKKQSVSSTATLSVTHR